MQFALSRLNQLFFDHCLDIPNYHYSNYEISDDFRPEDYGLPPYEDYDEQSNDSEE